MSSLESKGKFRTHFLRLAEKRDIPTNDIYWELYWNYPKSASDVFDAISNTDIRSVCNTRNFVKLLRIVSTRLIYISNEKEHDLESLPILNCLRILTRFLPFFYENPVFARAELQVFWSLTGSQPPLKARSPTSTVATVGTVDTASTYSNQDYDQASVEANLDFSNQNDDVKSDRVEISLSDSNAPLGAQLVNTAVNLLFTRGFTVISPSGRSSTGIEFSIWEAGIGQMGDPAPIKPEIDCNRLEVLRFLITLCSQCIYNPPGKVVAKGSRYLTVLVSTIPKLHILTLLTSLTNLVCRCSKNTPENGLSLGNNTLDRLRNLLVTSSMQLLTLMIVYPLPKDDLLFLEKTGIFIGKPYNSVRYYFGKLHKEQELNYIITSFITLLRKPSVEVLEIERSSSISSMIKSKTSNVEPSFCGIEAVMLLWELYQCNKKLRLQLINTAGPELMLVLLYNITTFRKHENYVNFVRVSSYFFLLLTSDLQLLFKILDPIRRDHLEGLLDSFKITPDPITYRDFLVSKLCQILISDDITILSPTLNECLFNLIPLAGDFEKSMRTENRRTSISSTDIFRSSGGGLSLATSNSICQLIIKYSAHRFLTGNESNLDYLALIMRAISQAICRFPKQSKCLIYCIVKNSKYFETIGITIDNMELNESDEDNETPEPTSAHVDDQNSIQNGDLTMDPKYTPYSYGHKSYNFVDDEEEHYSDLEDDEVDDRLLRPKLPMGMSMKAKGKMPLHASLKRTWTGRTAFNIILNLTSIFSQAVPEFDEVDRIDPMLLLQKIEEIDFPELIEPIVPSEYSVQRSNLEQLRFVWTNLSLGWYESILWKAIFANNDVIARKFSKMISLNSTISTFSKVSSDWGFGRWSNSESDSVEIVNKYLFSTNIWYGTKIRLFNCDNFVTYHKSNLSDQLIRRLSDFKLGSAAPLSPTNPVSSMQQQRQNSVTSLNSTAPSTPVLQKEDQFGEQIPSIKVTPRNSMHRLSVSSNFNSPKVLSRTNTNGSITPIMGSPRNSISL